MAATSTLASAGLYLTDRPGLIAPVIAGGVAFSALRVRTGLRTNARRELIDSLRAALTPLIGDDAHVLVRASRWTGPGIGHPSTLRIVYSPAARDDNPEWRKQVKDTVSRRLVVEAATARQDQRRRRLDLVLTPMIDPESTPADVVRAQLVVHKLFGAEAKFDYDLGADGELRRVSVEHEPDAKLAMKQARMRVERTFSAMLPNRWRAKWDPIKDTAIFEVRPTLPTVIPHAPTPITEENRYKIPVAFDEDLNPVLWNLRGSGPHCLCAGRTGTGKTVFINGAAMEFARRGWPIWICDPKQIEFIGMQEWPNVQIVATTIVEMVAAIKAAQDLMEERYTAIKNGADESDFEPVLLVLDEYRNFIRLVTAWWGTIRPPRSKLPSKCPVFDWVAAIAEKGRSAMIHILMGTQRPDAAFLGEGMRDNFDTRVSMGALSPQGAQMMWDSPYLGVAVPRSIRGRGTAISESEQVAEIQVPWTPDPRRATKNDNHQDLQLLEALRPTTAQHGPLELDLGDEEDLDGVEIDLWTQLMESVWRPRLGPAKPTPHAEVPTVAALELTIVEPDPSDLVDDREDRDLDEFAAYGEELSISASRVQPGDLVMVDEQLELWAVVEAVEEDLVDEGQLVIDWRSNDDDGGGSLSIDPGQSIRTRRMPTTDDDTIEED